MFKNNNAKNQDTYRKKQKQVGNITKHFYLNPENSKCLHSEKMRTGKTFNVLINEALHTAYTVRELVKYNFKNENENIQTNKEEERKELDWENLK